MEASQTAATIATLSPMSTAQMEEQIMTSIGGRGPMVVRAMGDEGNELLVVFDPAGVFIDCDVANSHQHRYIDSGSSGNKN